MGKFAVMTLKHSDKSSYDGSEKTMVFCIRLPQLLDGGLLTGILKFSQRFNIGSGSGTGVRS